jgi:hypothetical protein
VAEPLISLNATNTKGAPSFAYFAKGGTRKCSHNRTSNTCVGGIATHPFDYAQGRLLQTTQEPALSVVEGMGHPSFHYWNDTQSP